MRTSTAFCRLSGCSTGPPRNQGSHLLQALSGVSGITHLSASMPVFQCPSLRDGLCLSSHEMPHKATPCPCTYDTGDSFACSPAVSITVGGTTAGVLPMTGRTAMSGPSVPHRPWDSNTE